MGIELYVTNDGKEYCLVKNNLFVAILYPGEKKWTKIDSRRMKPSLDSFGFFHKRVPLTKEIKESLKIPKSYK